MKNIGFPISHKENEKRRAIMPEHVKHIICPQNLYFEKGYGDVLGISDKCYMELGCNICSADDVLLCDVICDPKIGDADYLDRLCSQTIFGWIHATQNKDITDKIINGRLTAIAWEKMYEDGRHIFWRNNELAGEAAIMHAFQCYGKMPYETKVAVLGRGNTARGAIKILNMLGAEVFQYDKKTENLLRKEIANYDVIVNCILWDVNRDDHIIYEDDLLKMKPNSMIVDVSCDRHGGVESCIPTTLVSPTYKKNGVLHYAVDHTPTIFYKTFTLNNSSIIYPFINQLITNKMENVLQKAIIIEHGKIVDEEINLFQNRR
jgi:N5-(carboxyethyl)ornithine synthase